MARASMCSSAGPLSASSFSASKEQALVLLVVQQLAEAQFVRADPVASERLWQEVAALQLDIERVTHLLYCGQSWMDRQALRAEDKAWLACRPVRRPQRWGVGGWRLGRGRSQTRSSVCAL